MIENRKNGTRRVAKEFKKPSLVEQSHQDRVNINSIMNRARKTGMVPVYNKQATYGDFTNVEDFQTSMNRVIQAQNDFMALPASIRKEFGNDPARLVDFMSDENNFDRAVEIGLLEKPRKQDPVQVTVVTDAEGSAATALESGSTEGAKT